MKLSSRNRIFKWMMALFLAAVTSIWASDYFNTKVFYLDDNKYSEKASDFPQTSQYQSWFGEPIWVSDDQDYKRLQINSEVYRLKELESTSVTKTYQVTYPNGNIYTVEDLNNSGFLMAYDQNGEIYVNFRAYSNNGRILTPGEEYYHPSSLVTAAYEKYHERQENLFLFIVSILLFIYGWCSFRIEAFQRFQFKISYGLWVVDPEPSDFYFTVTKIGAIAGMVISGLLLFMSLK